MVKANGRDTNDLGWVRPWAAITAILSVGCVAPAGSPETPGPPALAAAGIPTDAPALVMVFAEECGPSMLNVANWLDLAWYANEHDAAVHFVALTVGELEPAAALWQAFERLVDVRVVDLPTMIYDLHILETPHTMMIENGAVVEQMTGVLSLRDKERLRRLLRGNGPSLPV